MITLPIIMDARLALPAVPKVKRKIPPPIKKTAIIPVTTSDTLADGFFLVLII